MGRQLFSRSVKLCATLPGYHLRQSIYPFNELSQEEIQGPAEFGPFRAKCITFMLDPPLSQVKLFGKTFPKSKGSLTKIRVYQIGLSQK